METELEKARQQLQLKKTQFEEKLNKVGRNTEMSEEEKVAFMKPTRDENQAARKVVAELEKKEDNEL